MNADSLDTRIQHPIVYPLTRQRVEPTSCLGCSERARCERAYAADHSIGA
jgi:hypothetical protein